MKSAEKKLKDGHICAKTTVNVDLRGYLFKKLEIIILWIHTCLNCWEMSKRAKRCKLLPLYKHLNRLAKIGTVINQVNWRYAPAPAKADMTVNLRADKITTSWWFPRSLISRV